MAKKKATTDYEIEMRVTLKGSVSVSAESAEEAMRKAERGDFEFNVNAMEMIDYSAMSPAREG